MTSATFSIVVNTDGRHQDLEKTLRSFRFIDYPSFEVCVVFGPTDDGTKQLVESYAGRLKIGHCPQRNLSMSRNIGIAMAAGEYVAFIDDDAFPEAEWLRDLERGYDSIEIGGSGGRVYDFTGRRFQYGYAVADRLGNAEWHHDSPAEEFNFPLSDKFMYLQGTNASFRRSALLAIGGFDEEIEYYLDETDVCCRLVDAGYRLRQVKDGFVHHKMLPSELRNQHRVVRNRFPVVKNKIYFSIVNNHGHYGMNEVVTDACRFISLHAQDVKSHSDAGRLSPEDVTQFWQDIDRAWEQGMRRGLSGRRRLMHVAASRAWHAPYLEFPRNLPDGGRKVFCFLSKEYPPGRVGGIGTYTENAARELAKLGHHVHVLSEGKNTTDFENEVWVHRLRVKDIDPKPAHVLVPAQIWNHSATMREELFAIARRRKITAVESPIWDVEGIAIALDANLPHVVSLHTTFGIWLDTNEYRANDETYMHGFGKPLLNLEKYIILNADGVHANSQAITDSVRTFHNILDTAVDMRIIHHGISDPLSLSLTRFPRKRDEICLLFVGRLERRKGIDLFLGAIAPLLAEHERIRCDIVGDDSVPWDARWTFRDAFVNSPLAAVCAGHVHFHGKVPTEDLYGFFARADILVVPSRFESFGLTVIEGFAFGKAVVASRAGGMAEIIDDGVTGMLVAPEDVTALSSALRRLIADRELRVQLGGAARLAYECRFSGERMARALAKFLCGFERFVVPMSEFTLAGEPRVDISLCGDERGILLTPGDHLKFRGQDGTLHLTFWCHTWSGVVRVRSNDTILGEWDLYADPPRLRTIRIAEIPVGRVTIEPTGRHSKKARGAEVIFYQAAFSTGQDRTALAGPRKRSLRGTEPHRRRALAV